MFLIHLYLLWLLIHYFCVFWLPCFSFAFFFLFHVTLSKGFEFFRLTLFLSMTWGGDHIIAILRPVIRFFSKKILFPLLCFSSSPVISHLTLLYPELATLTSIFFWALKFQILRTVSGSLIPLRHKSSNPTYHFGCFLCFWYKDLQVEISFLPFKIQYAFIL